MRPDTDSAHEATALDDEALATSRGSSVLLVSGSVAVSVGALALLLRVYASGPPTLPSVEAASETQTAPRAEPGAQALVVPAEPSLATPPPLPTSPDALVVPDFTDTRVPAARRRAREVGLRLVIRDRWGQAIDPFGARRYRVVSQSVEPGAQREHGDVVRALAEDPSPPIAMGY